MFMPPVLVISDAFATIKERDTPIQRRFVLPIEVSQFPIARLYVTHLSEMGG